jgi:ECF sigma factor
MSDVTSILSQIESGDPAAAEQLLPPVYDELRKLAAAKLAYEKPGQTLQATALDCAFGRTPRYIQSRSCPCECQSPE